MSRKRPCRIEQRVCDRIVFRRELYLEESRSCDGMGIEGTDLVFLLSDGESGDEYLRQDGSIECEKP